MINKKLVITIVGIIVLVAIAIQFWPQESAQANAKSGTLIELPAPRYTSDIPLEDTILNRRSVREYKGEPLALEEVSQLLWSAQGITGDGFKRAAPSAGALYPLEIYVLAGNVENITPGMYHYLPNVHSLEKISDKDFRSELTKAAYGQVYIENAPANLVFTAIYERTTKKYGDKGIRYVHMEAGHAAQNVYLQAVALGLGTVTVGGFDDSEVKKILELPHDEEPLYIMPLGKV